MKDITKNELLLTRGLSKERVNGKPERHFFYHAKAILSMKDYSIHNSIKNIDSKRTKEYFKEVASSYYNGNYRAAIVVLYSVVISDIINKLEFLKEIYNDKTAEKILDEKEALQKENPYSSEWEKNLIEDVKKRTKIIGNIEYTHIQSLQNLRNLCAHPVINNEDRLYTPNEETVAAHIRNMLESLFLRPPILSKKILSTLLGDLAEKREILIEQENLDKYIKAKYLKNLNKPIQCDLFRALWKFVFKLENEESEKNRLINFMTLKLLYGRNPYECQKRIREEKDFFSTVADSGQPLRYLISFIAENEFILDDLREDVRIIINDSTKEPANKIVAWFLNKSLSDHFKAIKDWIKAKYCPILPQRYGIEAYSKLVKIGFLKGFENETIKFIIWTYSAVTTYNDADSIFSYLVYPNLKYFEETDIKELCEGANRNSQTYDRKRALDDHKKLKEYIRNNINSDFNFDEYKSVFQ